MFIVPDNDPSLMNLTKSERIAYDRIEKSLSDLTKRVDELDDFMKRAHATLDEVQAANARRAEDAAIVREFNETGRTPAALLVRRAKEGYAL